MPWRSVDAASARHQNSDRRPVTHTERTSTARGVRRGLRAGFLLTDRRRPDADRWDRLLPWVPPQHAKTMGEQRMRVVGAVDPLIVYPGPAAAPSLLTYLISPWPFSRCPARPLAVRRHSPPVLPPGRGPVVSGQPATMACDSAPPDFSRNRTVARTPKRWGRGRSLTVGRMPLCTPRHRRLCRV